MFSVLYLFGPRLSLLVLVGTKALTKTKKILLFASWEDALQSHMRVELLAKRFFVVDTDETIIAPKLFLLKNQHHHSNVVICRMYAECIPPKQNINSCTTSVGNTDLSS